MVLRKDPPSFLPVPGTTFVVPLEEVIKGYFLAQLPELERAEAFTFRFTTGAATVRERAPQPGPPALEPDGEVEMDPATPAVGDPEAPADMDQANSSESDPVDALPLFLETRQSVVVRVIANRRMPESYQAQLLRALERQVSRKDPLIGWSDLYPVTGPLELSGWDRLLDLREE